MFSKKTERRGAKKNQGSKYVHILRALRPGDVIYLPELHSRTGELIRVAAREFGGDCRTQRYMATAMTPETAHIIIQVTMTRAMKA